MSFFITLEGPDGSGKSTQAVRLAEWLTQQGQQVLLTREPGGSDVGQQIREILLTPANTNMQHETEFLLFSASRAQLVREVLRPHLAKGGVVLCDRYADSSIAYQGYGHGLDLNTIQQVTAFATGGLTPDLTLLFDIDPEAGLRRRQTNSEDWNRLDAMALAFHQRVREGFLALAQANPKRWLVLDASQSADAITDQIIAAVADRLQRS